MDERFVHAIMHLVQHAAHHLTAKHETPASKAAAEAERQRLASERAAERERERLLYLQRLQQERDRREYERRVRAQERPAKAMAYGVTTFLGFIILGAFLGFAGGMGWFWHESINSYYSVEMAKEIAKGTDQTNPIGLAIGKYLMGRFSENRVQCALADASLPLFPIAALLCLGFFGTGWDKRGFVGGWVLVASWPGSLLGTDKIVR